MALLSRFELIFFASVIPGRAEGANPKSRNTFKNGVWIPGPALRAIPE